MQALVRPARPDDVPRMLELVRELALFERAPEQVTVTLEHMRDAGFGPKAVWTGWVAELDGTIQGLAVCYERYSTWKGRRLYLEDIVVTEAARGQRIGERLFLACVQHAVEQGHNGMLWQVLDWNAGAIRFYERFGAAFAKEWLYGSLGREQLEALASRKP